MRNLRMRRFVSILLVLCMLLGVAACSSKGNNQTKTPDDASQNGAKDTFTMGMAAEPTALDPAASKDLVTWMIMVQLYDTLLRYDIKTQTYEPALATDWEFNADSTEVTFTIRDGVKFQNGDIMTADDVVWSLERALASSFTSQVNGSIDHFEKVDDQHIKVVLKYSYAPILQVMTTPCWGIVSRRAVEEAEAAGIDFGRNPCGTGAYQLTNWSSGEKLEFVAFDDYWDGAPKIKNVVARVVSDQATGSLALQDGTLDYYNSVPIAELDHLSMLNTLNVLEIPSTTLIDITFNTVEGPFVSKELRQAVAYALVKEDILIGGNEGKGEITNCFGLPASVGYLADYEAHEYNLEKAKQLVIDAGYPNGVDVVFRQDSNSLYMLPAEVVQAQLKKVGINVTFEKLERSAWTEMVGNNRDFQATLRGTTLAILDADYLLTRRLSATMIGNANNFSGYTNPKLDALLDQARSLSDMDERNAIYRQCYDIIQEDCPIISLYAMGGGQVTNAKLHGMQDDPNWRNLWYKLWFEA